MIQFVQKIKDLFNLSQRIRIVESELNEMEQKLKDAVANYSMQFEKKIQEMSFNYTKNLDDTKSDYLKRYLEVRMNCMQEQLTQLPYKLESVQNELERVNLKLEQIEDDI